MVDEPTEDDCCHSDCKNCVLDISQRQLASASFNRSKDRVNSAISQTRYRPFRLVKITVDAAQSNIYTFVPEQQSGEQEFFFKPGDHAILKNEPATPESDHLSREYTLIPWECGEHRCSFSCVIKLYPGGKMSQYIKSWRVGQVSYWRGLYGNFDYQPNAYSKIFMICMGTGVAPMYALAKFITEDENDETLINLLYGSRSPEEIILRQQINRLAGFWNFSCTHYISDGYEKGQRRFKEDFVEGRITCEVVLKNLKNYDPNTIIMILICGSERFNREINDCVNNMKNPSLNIHVFS